MKRTLFTLYYIIIILFSVMLFPLSYLIDCIGEFKVFNLKDNFKEYWEDSIQDLRINILDIWK